MKYNQSEKNDNVVIGLHTSYTLGCASKVRKYCIEPFLVLWLIWISGWRHRCQVGGQVLWHLKLKHFDILKILGSCNCQA